jgi:hypothetical protein
MKKFGLALLILAIGATIGVRISGTLSPVEGQSSPVLDSLPFFWIYHGQNPGV